VVREFSFWLEQSTSTDVRLEQSTYFHKCTAGTVYFHKKVKLARQCLVNNLYISWKSGSLFSDCRLRTDRRRRKAG